MPKQVFRYRTRNQFLIVAFLFAWAAFWLICLSFAWSGGKASVNGRPATLTEIGGLYLIGIAVQCFAIGRLLYCMNCRIEIEDGVIRWFDWRDRLKVQGTLESVDNVRRKLLFGRWQIFTTDGGSIRFEEHIENVKLLKAIVDTKSERPVIQGF